MRRLPLLIFLVLVAFPMMPHAAASPSAGAPAWRVGDRWSYDVTVRSPSGTTQGELTVTVADDRPVKVGNATFDAYTVRQKRSDWSYGYNITITTTLVIDKKTLCTLSSNSSTVSHFGTVSSEVREEDLYAPSDGRYRFPLAAGQNWTATYNLTRTRYFSFDHTVDNSTVIRRYSCLAYESVNYKEKGFRVECSAELGGPSATYWYGPHYQGEVMREEYDRGSDTTTTYRLRSYSQGPEASFLSSPDTQRALVLGLAALTLAFVAAGLVIMRRRVPNRRPPETPTEEPLAAFHIQQTRGGLALTVSTKTILCPSCRRTFKVPVTARSVRCPHCGREGELG
jgi:LSD1 subclass zinc finger protein